MFKKATKAAAKLRLALCGPAGSGKTYSSLRIATALADGGKIAVVDTERGSASKYADVFRFDTMQPETFDPRQLIEAIDYAEKNGYAVLIADSLSHYWMGTGGELDLVDSVAKRDARGNGNGNSFAAWKTVTPIHNKLVEKIIGCKLHIIATMRTKTEWVLEKNDAGKQVPRKIGLAPIMRDGIEFEFDVCGDMDQENNLIVTKSRCSALSGKVINQPGPEMAGTLKAWLTGSSAPAAQEKPVNPTPAGSAAKASSSSNLSQASTGKPSPSTSAPTAPASTQQQSAQAAKHETAGEEEARLRAENPPGKFRQFICLKCYGIFGFESGSVPKRCDCGHGVFTEVREGENAQTKRKMLKEEAERSMVSKSDLRKMTELMDVCKMPKEGRKETLENIVGRTLTKAEEMTQNEANIVFAKLNSIIAENNSASKKAA